jgi:Protein of unknown function (DUF1570)/Papain family cysteine protease
MLIVFAEVVGMKRLYLAAAFLFPSAGLAPADYVILAANLGPSKEMTQPEDGMSGIPGGRPLGGARLVFGNAGRLPGGVGGMFGIPNSTVIGDRSGRRGMRDILPFPGMSNGLTDVEDAPFSILAVVEVKPTSGNLLKKLAERRIRMSSAKVKHKWGTSTLLAKTDFCETIVLTQDNDQKPLPAVSDRFNNKFAKTFKSKPTTEGVLELADWTLMHGLIDKFPQIMDKLLEIDPSHPTSVAYRKIKAELDKPLVRDDVGVHWRNKLLSGYKVTETDHHHYVIVHNSASEDALDVRAPLDLLENSFRGFYYWFALKGIALPVPNQRQAAVVTSREKDFHHLHKILTSGPVVVDGFFARRENVSVMSAERMDESYEMLKKAWANFGDRGFERTAILSGKPGAGRPKYGITQEQAATAQMAALLLKALENEAELATISHDASRQLLFASGLVSRNVAAPEWIQFGIGSFFETPLQSPWASIGAPSAYYLPRWHELKDKDFEKSPGDTLRNVVNDAYFRNLPPKGKAESSTRRAYDAALRKARTASWSLTYFLAKDEQRLPGLMRYFKELSKMPRDLELDEEVLLDCFARAFGAVDASNKVDKAKLSALANQWYSYLDYVKFESESTVKQIHEVFKKKQMESQELCKQSQPSSNVPSGVFPINGDGLDVFSLNGSNSGVFPIKSGGPGGNRPLIVPLGSGSQLAVGGDAVALAGDVVRSGKKGSTPTTRRYDLLSSRPEQLAALPKYVASPQLAANLPVRVDLSGKFPKAYKQGQEGSCTANMSAGLIQYDQFVQGLALIMPSRQFDYYNSRLLEGTANQDGGASIGDAVRSLIDYGWCPESMWPYQLSNLTTKPTQACYNTAEPNKVQAAACFTVQQNAKTIKTALASGEPIGFGFIVYPSFESNAVSTSGMVPMPSSNDYSQGPLGGHAIILVGYDDAKQAFKFRNSWGTLWGLNGYGWMPYQYVLNPSLAFDFMIMRRIPDGK